MRAAMKAFALLAVLGLIRCGGQTDESTLSVGSNSNWLRPCAGSGECDVSLTCLCGVCTTSCAEVACPVGTACAAPGGDVCRAAAEAACVALCADDAQCASALGAGYECSVGRCAALAAGGGGTASAGGSGDATGIAGSASGGETRIVSIGTLTNSPAPASCVADLPALLPGCDPNVLAYSGIDCDADGVPDHRLWRCEVASAELPGDFTGRFDCEPTDPGLRYWVMRDADGDGFGVSSGEGALCAGPVIPEGYVLAEGVSLDDCDDDDPGVRPGAVDTWGDGVDSDCQNGDAPRCDVLGFGAVLPRVAAGDSPCSDAPDLHLSSLVHCGGRCPSSGDLWGFVGNAGGAPAPGTIAVTWENDRGEAGRIDVTTAGLAPGETSAPFRVPTERTTRVSIRIDFDDCQPENGVVVDENESGDQVCL